MVIHQIFNGSKIYIGEYILEKKENKKMEIVDSLRIKGLQTFDNHGEILSPIDINIDTTAFWSFMQKYTQNKQYVYRVILEEAVFSSSVMNDKNQILVTCNGLNDAKKLFLNSDEMKALSIIYLNEVKN